jgi:ankyrin repeat protein
VCCHDRVLELIEILVEYGADVDAVDKRGEAPLHYATRCGNEDTSWFLLVNGATVDTDPVCRERTPLHVAAACGHAELASMLLKEGGAEPLATDAQGRTPRQVAVAEGRERQMGPVLSDCPVPRKQGESSFVHPAHVGQANGQVGGARRPARSTREMNDQNAFRALWG